MVVSSRNGNVAALRVHVENAYDTCRAVSQWVLSPILGQINRVAENVCSTIQRVKQEQNLSSERINNRIIETIQDISDRAIETAQGAVIVGRDLFLYAMDATVFTTATVTLLNYTNDHDDVISKLSMTVTKLGLTLLVGTGSVMLVSRLRNANGINGNQPLLIQSGSGVTASKIRLCGIIPKVTFGRGNDEKLFKAAYEGDCDQIRSLQRQGVNLEYIHPENGLTAIHYAVIGKQKESIKLLWYFGCKIDVLDKSFRAPIHYVSEEDEDFIGFLSELMNKKNRFELEEPVYQFYPPENLVFKGGGPKGIAYVGALEALDENSLLKDVRRVAGTSAGAITAMLVALGYSSKDIKQILEETDLKDFLDHGYKNEQDLLSGLATPFGKGQNATLKECLDSVSSIRAFADLYTSQNKLKNLKKEMIKAFQDGGICSGQRFLEWMESLIQKKTGISNCTFKEYKQLMQSRNFKHLYFYTTCITPEKLVCISTEDEDWDDVIIADAIRASMSIPEVFKAYTLRKKVEGVVKIAPELGVYVDGGIVMNSPVEIFDSHNYRATNSTEKLGVFNHQTLVLSLADLGAEPSARINSESLTMLDSLQSTLNVLSEGVHHRIESHPRNVQRTIVIDNLGVGTVSGFFSSKATKDNLIISGKNAVINFCHKQGKISTQYIDHAPIDALKLRFAENRLEQLQIVQEEKYPEGDSLEEDSKSGEFSQSRIILEEVSDRKVSDDSEVDEEELTYTQSDLSKEESVFE